MKPLKVLHVLENDKLLKYIILGGFYLYLLAEYREKIKKSNSSC